MPKVTSNQSELTLLMNDFEVEHVDGPVTTIPKLNKPVKRPINWSTITLSKARINELVLEAIKEFQLSQLETIRKAS